MDKLKEKFASIAAPMAQEVKEMVKNHGDVILGNYTVTSMYSGMKGIIGLATETSQLDHIEGIRFRGYTIPELRELLPKAVGGEEPLPEGLFYLMLIGELPTEQDVKDLSTLFAELADVPKHVYDVIDALPIDTHPMTQFTSAIVAMQTESVFAKKYAAGMNKKDYWDPTFEDCINLIAKLPIVASYIYRRTYKGGDHIPQDKSLDWGANFAKMLGVNDSDEFMALMRLYLTIHADHEGGNVSAHTTHLVGSALSDPYLSFAASMTGLAGPLHGLANQEVMKWIFEMVEELGTTKPTKEQIADYVNKTIKQGKVVPGYGHAVLRKTDPRFTAQEQFAKRHNIDDDYVNIVWNMYEVVPGILESLGKVKNPWPNVDAHSGSLLIHYGMKDYSFYTVLFGVSRALGVLAQLVWDRALGHPLERPKSVTTEWVKNKIAESVAKA